MNWPLEECMYLNSQAIASMRAGRHVECSIMLRNAIEKLEALFKLSQTNGQRLQGNGKTNSPNTGQGPDAINTDDNQLDRLETHPYRSVSVESQWTVKIKASSDMNVFAFFPRMFRVTSRGQSDLSLKKIFAILLFNEAVGQHIIAAHYVIEHNINPYHPFSRVLALYRDVAKVAGVSFCYQDAREMLCIIVAATNNFGHLCSQLLLLTETRDSIEHMIRLMGMSDNQSFGLEDLSIFFESTCIFLEGSPLSNAPAA